MLCYVLLCYVTVHDAISYHIISYHIISYHIISYHIISYHIISYHIISYHIISYHIISYHIVSYSNYISLYYLQSITTFNHNKLCSHRGLGLSCRSAPGPELAQKAWQLKVLESHPEERGGIV